MHSLVSTANSAGRSARLFSTLTRGATLALVTCTLLIGSLAVAGVMHPLVIYGDDNRKEVFEDQDAARQILAESVVAIMPSSAIDDKVAGNVTLKGGNYGKDNMLCATERFTEQSAPAYCSGFLVAPNIIATAGHCVQEPDFCHDARFVFDFMIDKEGRDPNQVKPEAVFSCKKILTDKMDNDGSDYALVELDRPVVGREPLKFAKAAPVVNDSVFVIGNPVGLPTKIADGASVRENESGYFVANLDTFGGNSGSAVFNENYEVAGILVRGENDFVRRGGCFVSYRCQNDMCRGEDVTNPNIVGAALDKILSPGTQVANSVTKRP